MTLLKGAFTWFVMGLITAAAVATTGFVLKAYWLLFNIGWGLL